MFKCDICGKEFSFYEGHLFFMNTEDERIEANICDYCMDLYGREFAMGIIKTKRENIQEEE